MVDFEEDDEDRHIRSIPTLTFYQRMYAGPADNNDQKATKYFKQYESQEKVRRLQSELLLVSQGMVSIKVLDAIIKKTRKAKYKTYEHWGKLMLQWLAEAKN